MYSRPSGAPRVCGVLAFCIAVLLARAAAAATVSVPAGGDLQAALDAARAGDVIELAPGATYVGPFTLPVVSGASADAWVTLRTAGTLPDRRVTAADAPLLATLVSRTPGMPTVITAPSAHHWRLDGLAITQTAGNTYDLVRLGSGDTDQNVAALVPHHLVVDRAYLHVSDGMAQRRGIALNASDVAITRSTIRNMKEAGADSQAIAGWNTPGRILIEDNYLEAAGENILFGGADPSINGLVPTDIVVRGNLLTKPQQWRGSAWQVKNAFELKNARRVLIEGNIFENVWVAAQAGFAILFTTRNQDGSAPWSVVEDVTFRYNIVRHVANVFNITGYDDLRPSQQGKRILIAHNLFYDIDGTRWGAGGLFLQVGNEPRDLTVEHNTVVHTGNVMTVYGRRNGAPAVVDGFVFRNNFMRHNAYGVIGENLAIGNNSLETYFRNLVFVSNVLAGGHAGSYPAGNFFPSVAEFDGAFTNSASEDFTLIAGSPYRASATDGGALGADVNTVMAATRGVPVSVSPAPGNTSGPPDSTGREAICRAGHACSTTGDGSRTPRN